MIRALPDPLRRRRSATVTACLLLLVALLAPAARADAAPAPDPANGRYRLPLSDDRHNNAAQQIELQSASADPATLAALRKIAAQPSANWYGGATDTVAALVRWRVEDAAARGGVAQLVTFNLPDRGCDGAVEPGPTTAAAYKAWFRQFLAGLGRHRAVVVVEPDALGLASCLPRAKRLQRYSLIAWSVRALHRQGSWAYIDAGHSRWLSTRVAANRLRASGVRWAAGFSLNVSNFRPDAELIRYGSAVSARTGGRHFVIDSGRNGAGDRISTYCNAPGAGLGRRPTARTGVRLLDAYLWIKDPGSSDGPCRGGPDAGHWWQPYALSLAANAAW